ncbi:glycerophosphodiester phosphodiesterase family protein [Mangrovicella endophytica]|uniref:glycerophosphodiester phosphodiesterase family protein n=1 Tax=Mangrovicella endophytica TaxID=2066697 RepID=UPI000C9E6AE7|nr:glycerophosphodiester phosphodiesterase family protein [Mangrovicella endophytica]
MPYGNDLAWLTRRPIAHRGLHDGNVSVPENSLAAARAAIEAGYPIECDVQLSSGGTPYIFHDDTLDRLARTDGAFRDADDRRLGALRLVGTDQAMPTVAEFLRLIDGRVPVVMELKGVGADKDGDYLARLLPMIEPYRGRLALMSFDEWLIDQALQADGPWPVGLTAEGTEPAVLDRHRAIYDRGCAFTSYNVDHLDNDFVRYVRNERRDPVISWTVRSPADQRRSAALADQITFEGFLPQS